MKAKKLPKAKCPYCRGNFQPVSRGGSKQRFCSQAHRKAYHKYGSLPLDKLMDRIRRELAGMVRLEVSMVRAEMEQEIREKMRVSLGGFTGGTV